VACGEKGEYCTAADVIEKAGGKIYTFDGKETELDPEGKYYDIDYRKLTKHASIKSDIRNFVLQNPVGDVYIIGAGKNNKKQPEPKPTETIPPEPVLWGREIKNYGGSGDDEFYAVVLASDGDLSGNKGSFDAIIVKFDADDNIASIE
jgi:hypothetical protein